MNSLRMCVTKKIKVKENFQNEDKLEQTFFLDKIDHFLAKKIIEITDPRLSKVEAIRQRKFIAKKITICFIEPKKPATWTSLNFLKSRVDNFGKPIVLDPLEETVRRMKPYDAFRVIIEERLAPIVPIKFEFVSNLKDAVVKIGFERDRGTWSLVGLDHFFSTEDVTLNMAWLDVGTILHELGHVLGMGHEHQNPLGRKIEWDEEKVYEWSRITNGWDKETTYENIIQTYNKDNLKATLYDPQSVMLYFFPAELTKNGKGSNQNFIMSIEDYRFLNTIMPNPRLTMQDVDDFWYTLYGETKTLFGIQKGSLTIRIITIALLVLSLIIFLYWAYIRSFDKQEEDEDEEEEKLVVGDEQFVDVTSSEVKMQSDSKNFDLSKKDFFEEEEESRNHNYHIPTNNQVEAMNFFANNISTASYALPSSSSTKKKKSKKLFLKDNLIFPRPLLPDIQ